MKIRIRRKTGAKTDIYLHKGFRRYFAAAYGTLKGFYGEESETR